MFDFGSPLFWYKIVFMIEIVIAESLLISWLKKKEHFIVRVILCLVALLGISFIYPLLFFDAYYASVMFFLLFAFTLLALKFCFDENWSNIVFCGLTAYTMQHIAHELFTFVAHITGIGNLNVYGATGDGVGTVGDIVSTTGITAINVAVYVSIYLFVYWLIWAMVTSRIRQRENLKLDNVFLIFWVIITLVVEIILNALVSYADDGTSSKTVLIAFALVNITSCVLSVVMQLLMLGKSDVEGDLKTVQTLWKRDKALYELSKENMELLNIRFHDLKTQFEVLKNLNGFLDDKVLEDIEQSISLYGIQIKTGNDALDVILAEKHMICDKNHITFSCIVDGCNVSFISPSDLYSMIGNALQNAIEATMQIPAVEQRVIRFKIFTKGKMLSIHVENTCPDDKEIEFADGIPLTTKINKAEHGYGVRSIKLIAERLGGAIDIHWGDGLFHLNVIIPIPEKD